jgi:transposase InsO family protein
MRTMGLHRVVRGKTVRTTISNAAAPCPLDRVNRQFRAPRPNALWVSDFTYLATWAGFVYVAFVIDAFARRIVGWRVSRTAHAGFVLDALEQALHERRPIRGGGLVHHSDRGVQYVSIKYTERLAAAGIEPSVGSVGDSYDNALAETINGLYKAEAIHRRGPLAQLRSGRVRHPRMGRLVQQPPRSRADRKPPSRRGRGHLLRPAGADPYRRVRLKQNCLRQTRCGSVIGDPTYADAILDRLVHNAHRIDLAGDSLRRTRPRSAAKD